jgi:hypothetical protein
MTGLARTLDEYWGPVEADFRRFYRLDLREACWGPEALGVRHLHSLVRNLPADSALAYAVGRRPRAAAHRPQSTAAQLRAFTEKM